MLVILFSLMFPTVSNAGLVYCDKECFKLKESHIVTVKGLLYEVMESQNKKTKKTFSAHAAETIVWMEEKYKEEKVYKLEDLKKDDKVNLVITSISFILDVIYGRTKFNPRVVLFRWGMVGEKVIAEYKENIVDKKTVIKYKLELKK
jgi:hypothetical protein